MPAETSARALGPSLVTGGCGFVGFHIVNALLKDPAWGPVSVVSRNPEVNRCEGARYYAGDICDVEKVQELLTVIKPRIIFHTAAPRASDVAVAPSDHHKTSVEGTQIVLDCARESPTVHALVYTSSSAVLEGHQHFNANETAPLWQQNSNTLPYYKTKALADTLVRAANCPIDHQGKGLLTVALRPSWMYGERDNTVLPEMLQTAERGQTRIQLGNNQNFVDPLDIGNAATAHLLAGRKLLTSDTGSAEPKVDGEAFLLTDGDSVPLWTFIRMMWRIAGDKTTLDQVRVIPGWLALFVAQAIDWAFYLCTLGSIRPPLKISPLYIGYTTSNTTYDISKARERLGYVPIIDREQQIKNSVVWDMEHYPEKYKMLLNSRSVDSKDPIKSNGDGAKKYA